MSGNKTRVSPLGWCDKAIHSTYANEALSRRFSIFFSGVVAVTTRLLFVSTVNAFASRINFE